MKTQTVMITREFGQPVYIAPLKNGEIQITDKAQDAEKWDTTKDRTKLAFHKAITGYKELCFETCS